jgi:hypothetical protein
VGDKWVISVNAPGIQKEYLKYDISIPLKYKSKHIFWRLFK